MYNCFFDYLMSVTSNDWDDLIFTHRVDLLEEAFYVLDIMSKHGKATHGLERRKFIAAVLKAILEDEPWTIKSRNLNEWLVFGGSSMSVSWLDAMAEKGLITYDRDKRLCEATDLLKSLSQPTLTVLEL